MALSRFVAQILSNESIAFRDLALIDLWMQVYNKEWSFGYCEVGSGVFHCQPKRNPMYTYRESIPLGRTSLTRVRVEAVVEELSQDWLGESYDLLARNCNHFCDAFCVRLGVERVPCKSPPFTL